MCDEKISLDQLDTLKQIERLLLSMATLPPIDVTVQLSANQPWVIDYHERTHIFVWFPSTQTVSFEDFGSGTMQGQVWTNLGLPQGVRMFATGTTSTVPMMVRCTNEVIP